MKLLKNSLLPIAGMLVLIFFLGVSYFNNYIYFDKLLLCSVILAIIFIIKIQENIPRPDADDQQFDRLQNNK